MSESVRLLQLSTLMPLLPATPPPPYGLCSILRLQTWPEALVFLLEQRQGGVEGGGLWTPGAF